MDTSGLYGLIYEISVNLLTRAPSLLFEGGICGLFQRNVVVIVPTEEIPIIHSHNR